MPAIPAGQLKKGHKVFLDGVRKLVIKVEEVKPECLSETFVTYEDGTTDQFCNFKNVLIEHEDPKYKEKVK